MKAILLELLENLEDYSNTHDEIGDSIVRDNLGNIVMNLYVRNNHEYIIPSDLGMYSAESNQELTSILMPYSIEWLKVRKNLA